MFELGPERDPSRTAQPNPPLLRSICQHEAAEVSECCKPTPRDQHASHGSFHKCISPCLLCSVFHPHPDGQVNLLQVPTLEGSTAWLCLHTVTHQGGVMKAVLLLLSVCIKSPSRLVLGKTSASLEAEVFSVYVTTHMDLQGLGAAVGRSTLSYTLKWILFPIISLLGPLSPFIHWGKVLEGARPLGQDCHWVRILQWHKILNSQILEQ